MKPCYTDDLWDNSLLKSGDRVINKINGKKGVVIVKLCTPTNLGDFDYLEVHYDDQTISNPYANQLGLI